MARPTKQGIDYFLLWKPHFRTEEKFRDTSKRAYKTLRSSCSSFIKKPQVRKLILKKYNYKCACCGSKKNLQIDHIISVYKAFKSKELISQLNTYQNLQILCRECNSKKAPEEEKQYE